MDTETLISLGKANKFETFDAILSRLLQTRYPPTLKDGDISDQPSHHLSLPSPDMVSSYLRFVVASHAMGASSPALFASLICLYQTPPDDNINGIISCSLRIPYLLVPDTTGR
eukprot:TRINITY_DN5042_c0_g1_i3.p2 TRINITY_DN5042_c0_g1~~TRINITY_DN5042_c0_g1_i3.p2  ORF type:complete len:113 (+),score=18.67 TRINITY_DN5042_c0_g1_i3:54-392(+)